MDLRTRVLSALGWAIGIKAVSQLINWAITLYVIRTLTPTDYGTMAIAMITVRPARCCLTTMKPGCRTTVTAKVWRADSEAICRVSSVKMGKPTASGTVCGKPFFWENKQRTS